MSDPCINKGSLSYAVATNNPQILVAYNNQRLLGDATHLPWVGRARLCAPYSETQADTATTISSITRCYGRGADRDHGGERSVLPSGEFLGL